MTNCPRHSDWMIRFAVLLAPIGVFGEEGMVSKPWEDVIVNYCLECHDADIQKGDVNLERLLDSPFDEQVAGWVEVLQQVESRHMPPAGEERPDEATFTTTTDAIVAALDSFAAKHPNPGRTDPVRRLTRTEYQNAIRDLLGIDIDVTELLPADESSHGFDNITVGELSPALLERYLDAAQKISRMAVGTSQKQPDSRTVRIRPDITQEDHIEGLPLGTRGGALISHLFPRDGDYDVRIFLTRDRNENVEGLHRPHQIEILLDGDPQAILRVTPPENRSDHTKVDADLRTRIKVEAGQRDLGVTFREDYSSLEETLRQPYQSHFNYHRHPRLSPAIYQVTITGPYDSSSAGMSGSRRRVLPEVPGAGQDPKAVAAENLRLLMRRAWRRAITEEDLDRVLAFFEEGYAVEKNFDAGMELALSAILVSREFLFRVEPDPEGLAPGTPYELSDLELASRLSFFLWSSLPDEELITAAEAGELTDSAKRSSQVLRMLSDPRAKTLVTNFADQWLYLRNLETITPDGRLFPDFDDNLRQAFRRETEWHFERMMREDRSVLDLLRSEETLLNERLAKHYGIPHIYGPRYREVKLKAGEPRGGLLRHGSVLSLTSYATRTSPVIRGHWILENILGTPPPPPPPNVPTLDDARIDENLPIREKLALHREKAACASCHELIDPVGFALENFDAVGRWRTLDAGAPIDAGGSLPGGAEFEGVAGLEEGILSRPEFFVRTLTEKLLTYALGRGIEPYDDPAIRRIVRESAEEDYRFSKLVLGVTSSEPFLRRMTGSPSSSQPSSH